MTESPETARLSHGRHWRSLREVSLIVLAVLIALGLEATWLYRLDRIDEREVLVGLLVELGENASRLQTSLSTHQRIDGAAEHFLAALEDVPTMGTVLIHDSVLGEVIRAPTYLPLRASLDAALSSGQIELIRSGEVQRSLASWSRLAAEALEEEQDARQFVSDQLLPALYQSGDLGPTFQTFVEATERRSETGILAYGDAASAIAVSAELINLLWRRRFYAATALTALSNLDSRLQATAELVEAELR